MGKNMKKLISLIMLVLLSTSVLGAGMSVAGTTNYGEVRKGQSYTKHLIYRIFDNDFTGSLEQLVVIYSTSQLLDFEEEITGTVNQVEHTSITLNVPKKVKPGEYTTRVCAKVLYGNVWRGACSDVLYNVVSGRGKKKK